MWGGIAAAAGNIVGGLIGAHGAKKQAEMESATQRDVANYNAQMQKEFAQKGVQWKVADAKEAGISPLAALGAQTHSFSPIQISGGSGPSPGQIMGNAVSDMGQNIGRSLMAVATQEERKRQLLQTKNLELKNQLLEQDLVRQQKYNSNLRTSWSNNPSMPLIEHQPSRITGQIGSKMSQQAGSIADVGFANTGTGLAPIPSQDVKERIEDQIVPESMWALRNYIMPNIGKGEMPTDQEVQRNFPGARGVKWSVLKQEWKPVYKEEANKIKLGRRKVRRLSEMLKRDKFK